jgi:hypothetical protein
MEADIIADIHGLRPPTVRKCLLSAKELPMM